MSTEAWGEPRARADGLAVWLRAPIDQPAAAGEGRRSSCTARRCTSGGGSGGSSWSPAGRRWPRWQPGCRRRRSRRSSASPAGREVDLLGRRAAARDGPSATASSSSSPPWTAARGAHRARAGRAPGARGGAASRRGASVAICMATYEPPPELLERQLDSLRAQTRSDWVCVISDDASGPGGVRGPRAADGRRPALSPSAAPPSARAPTGTSPGRWRWSRPTPPTSPSATRTTAGTSTSSRP